MTMPARPGILLATAMAATAISAVHSMSFQCIQIALLGLKEWSATRLDALSSI